jgi:hypothetical protein
MAPDLPILPCVFVAGVDADLRDLSCVLEREARLLLVASVAPGRDAVDALSLLHREEIHRALIVATVGEALALGPEPGLRDLMAAAPGDWAVSLGEQTARLQASPALPPSLRDFVES